MQDLASRIRELGSDLVKCNRSCKGITLRPSTGHVPRSLYFELGDAPEASGAVIVGMNPGQASQGELDFYVSQGGSYASLMEWFDRSGREHRYHKELRKIARSLGIQGPLLWTELAKCQSETAGEAPPLQTYRTCTAAFLEKELAAAPSSWPLLAVGRDAYGALAFRFPDRAVLGIPHPTGSKGHFPALFNNGRLAKKHLTSFRTVLESRSAAWLSAGDSGV